MSDTVNELPLFADLLASVSPSASKPGGARPRHELESALVRLGFKPSRKVLGLLGSLRIHRVAPLHLDLARRLAADPVALRRLRGVRIGEFLLDLMGFERVRVRLTRRFFQTFRPRAEQEELLWWDAAHLDLALRDDEIKVRAIDSAGQLLRQGKRARQILSAAGFPILPRSAAGATAGNPRDPTDRAAGR